VHAPTRYRIAPLDVHAHLFLVGCTIDDPAPDGQRFTLATWVPGSYFVREFARHFVAVRAEANGLAVPITKEAKDTWRAAPCNGPLTVIAEVYAFDLSVRAAYLDARRGYFNGATMFLCREGRADAPCEVEIMKPEFAGASEWRVATTLEPAGAALFDFGAYRASSYDELIDHPVEMASFARVSFDAGGARHEVTVTGRIHADLERVARDLARICQWQIDLFAGASGGRAPFDRYLFQVAAVGDGYGGLEHRSSTSLLCRRDELPAPGETSVSDGYRNFLGLASHEYFHSWNVKRIKPAIFVPYDLAREAYTRQLWAFEGITSYYDDLALVRSGVVEPASYLELLGRAITTVLRTPGRRRQSVAESSFDAWIKFYRSDENTPNAVVSYYAKGSLIALALDLVLRRTGSSLDAVMRTLWQRFGQTGIGVPERAIAGIAGEHAQRDLTDFFSRHVDGIEDPPLAALLADVGVKLNVRAAEGDDDRGGKPGNTTERGESSPRSWLGTKLSGATEPRLQHVYTGGPAERAGLAGGDTLIALDGVRASVDSIGKLLARHRPGETVTVHAFRRDELVVADLLLEAAPLDTCWLTLAATVDDATRARRNAWLGLAA